MGLYERFVLPRLVHFVCGLETHRRQRLKVVPMAAGDVLEIGFGSGLNLAHYDPAAVRKLWALEPAAEMWDLAQEAVVRSALPVELLQVSAEEIPLSDESVDTILMTYTLCTIPDAPRALTEARRVLRPGGRLLFCEHGTAPDERVRRWQERINPLWRRLAGGCNVNRHAPSLIEAGGFRVEQLSSRYLPGWRLASFNFWGVAVPSEPPARGGR
ncbi:MAG: class I SAM-dependent methyltransferase [Thermoanaerobaculia bacterium]|nr:class I SAM-dependent methyltransferase [Thermoanaerobaculia bacterium]MBP9826833.1 class I SAM-dependent methyltransferase [Thermoanaerobaculia bacterium]